MAARKLKNRIAAVGIELEGGWDKVPVGLRPESIIRDGSVIFNPPANQRLTAAVLERMDDRPIPSMKFPKYIGEIPSPVLRVDAYEDWIRANYPQHVNETCGLHTHMSFKYRLNYMRLMTPEYTPYIVKGLKEWAEEEKFAKSHPIWVRLNKKDHPHCAHVYLGDKQVAVDHKDFHSRGKPHSRYTFINYCWTQQAQRTGGPGTVECRGLPMMETPDQAIRAVSEVYRLTNKFLAMMKSREPRAEAKVALPPATYSRTRIRV
jgi:hypothetical protein